MVPRSSIKEFKKLFPQQPSPWYALIPLLSISLGYSIIGGQYWSCNHLRFMVDFSAIPSWLIYLGFHSWPMIIIHSLWGTCLNFKLVVSFLFIIYSKGPTGWWLSHPPENSQIGNLPPSNKKGWLKKIKQMWTKPLEPSMFFKNIWTETTFRTLSSHPFAPRSGASTKDFCRYLRKSDFKAQGFQSSVQVTQETESKAIKWTNEPPHLGRVAAAKYLALCPTCSKPWTSNVNSLWNWTLTPWF